MKNVRVKMLQEVPLRQLQSYLEELPALQAAAKQAQKRLAQAESALLSGREVVFVECTLDEDNVLRRKDTGEMLERRGVQLMMFEEEETDV